MRILFTSVPFHLLLLFAVTARGAGDPVRLTTDGDFKQHLTWSPDGKKFLFTRIHGGKMGLWTMNADGRELKPQLNSNAPHFDGCWSSNSKKIFFVFDYLQGMDGKLQINSVNADGSDNKVIIPNKSFEESPRLSPDGKSLLFVSTRDGNQDIYSADADGKNINRLTKDPAADYTPQWSPNGKQIAFSSGRFGNLEVCLMEADGFNVRRLTKGNAMSYWPVWSPDGKKIAFTSNRDGNYEIYLMNADGSDPKNLTNHPAQENYASWSPNGRRLAFISNRHGGFDIYIIDLK